MTRPYFKNFNKRLIKAPKLYFLDTGLAAFLLDIQNAAQMATHPLRGALFEALMVSELLKRRFNSARTDNLYYFRDNVGNEIDLILDHGAVLDAIEIKSGQTIAKDFFKSLNYLARLTDTLRDAYLMYGGDRSYIRNGVRVLSWKDLAQMEA
jgi:predicted AAA+ superfamily ATPase